MQDVLSSECTQRYPHTVSHCAVLWSLLQLLFSKQALVWFRVSGSKPCLTDVVADIQWEQQKLALLSISQSRLCLQEHAGARALRACSLAHGRCQVVGLQDVSTVTPIIIVMSASKQERV